VYSRVYVEITNICNMHCSFCHGHSRTLRRMTEGDFSTVLEKLKGQTEYIYYHLMGEPLTHPALPRFLTLAKEKGFRSVITTNGTLLQKRGEELLAADLHKVSISLHSFEEGNDEIQRRYLAQVADFAEKGANKGVLISFRLWNKGFDGGKNDITESFLRERLPGDWTKNSRGYRIRDKIYLEWGDRFLWPDQEAPDLGREVTCYGLRDHFGILCDGSVVPCCLDSDGVITLGNIFQESIEDILSSSRAKAIAEGFRCRKATEELCRRCGYARRF